MSFSVCDQSIGFEYNGNNLNSLFAQRRNILSPGFWGMLRDILRFNRQAPLDLQEQRISADMTLGDYLTAGGYGPRFIRHYIVPMGAAIWSMSLADMLKFPAIFVRFFKNHGLLSVSNRPQWCVIEGGSSRYIEPLTRSFREQIRLNCPVHKVQRSDEGVVIHSPAGSETFDRVVFACHSDQALALLDDPSQAEQQILGALPYANNDVVLHTDTRLLPDRKLAWASWNYRLTGNTQQQAAVTYDMNILQGIDSATTFCVSLNPNADDQPAEDPGALHLRASAIQLGRSGGAGTLGRIERRAQYLYCGAYWANGFHEDGVVSALRVAQAFGETL